jgi:adenosylcobinamide-phosphate synthase
MLSAGAMLVALALEAAFGWPDWIYRRVGHPVTWIGAMITWLEGRLNRPGALRVVAGGAVTVAVTVSAAGAAWMLAQLVPAPPLGMVISGVLAAPLVAARSLHDHVAAVAQRLAENDLEAAQLAVAKIVGRETQASTRRAYRGRRWKASPRMPPTESWRLYSGAFCWVCRASRATRRSTRSTA